MKKILLMVSLLLMTTMLFACETSGYTLTYEVNGGSAIASIKLNEGDVVSEPTEPTKEGFVFANWYSDIDFLKEYTFPGEMPASNLTIYAKWEVAIYFETNGGDAVDAVLGLPDSFMTAALPTPVRGQDSFEGWYTDEELTTEYTALKFPDTSITLYAKWSSLNTRTAIDLSDGWAANSSSEYSTEVVSDGVKFSALDTKGEWAYVYTTINYGVKTYNTIMLNLEGTEGIQILLKLEGGDATVKEEYFTLTGEDQTILWNVDDTYLSSISGQMLMIFLNPGVAGATADAAEYVTVKSAGAYQTTDDETVAIFFNSNGGSSITTYYELPDTEITAPEDPILAGYQFDGWYTDEEFTTEYVFDKMGDESIVLYAKWIESIDIVEDTKIDVNNSFVNVDANAYTITEADGTLTITETADKGEWSSVKRTMTDSLTNYRYFTATFTGTAGSTVMFKLGNGVEYWVDLTGEEQTIKWIYDITPVEVLIFVNGGSTSKSTTVTITEMAFYKLLEDADKADSIKADTELLTNWSSNDAGVYTVSNSDDGVTIASTSLKNDWQFVKYTFGDGQTLDSYSYLHVVFEADDIFIGTNLLIKVDGVDQRIVMTGDVQDVYLNISATGTDLFMFFADGDAVAGSIFFSTITLTNYKDTLVMDGWSSLDEGVYTISNSNNQLTIASTSSKTSWQFVKYTFGDDETSVGYSYLHLTFKADEAFIGTNLLVKIGGVEYRIVITGETQDVYIQIATTYDELLFCYSDNAAIAGSIVFDEISLTNTK